MCNAVTMCNDVTPLSAALPLSDPRMPCCMLRLYDYISEVIIHFQHVIAQPTTLFYFAFQLPATAIFYKTSFDLKSLKQFFLKTPKLSDSDKIFSPQKAENAADIAASKGSAIGEELANIVYANAQYNCVKSVSTHTHIPREHHTLHLAHGTNFVDSIFNSNKNVI